MVGSVSRCGATPTDALRRRTAGWPSRWQNLAAAAVYQALLRERAEAQRSRLEFVAHITGTLKHTDSPRRMAEQIAVLGAKYLADYCTVSLAENGKLVLYRTGARDAAGQAAMDAMTDYYMRTGREPKKTAEVFRTGQPTLNTHVDNQS